MGGMPGGKGGMGGYADVAAKLFIFDLKLPLEDFLRANRLDRLRGDGDNDADPWIQSASFRGARATARSWERQTQSKSRPKQCAAQHVNPATKTRL